jgi:DNA polymerase III delta prime subunit
VPRLYNREVDERALVRSLSRLRQLIEAEHALALDRAASVPPLAFETASAFGGDTGRAYGFRASLEPTTPGGGPAVKTGDAVDVLMPDGRAAAASGTVTAITTTSVVVELYRPVAAGAIPSAGTLRVRVDANQHAVRLRAIERVVRERHALNWVAAVLTSADVMGLADASWDPPADLGVTDGQRRALVGASRSRDLFLIQGPPGTGKTTVIAALLRYFTTERGARVLLTSKGHRAVDNALDRLGSGDLHVLRLGQAGKVSGAGQEVRLADVVSDAERDVPRRHLAARTALHDRVESLADASASLGPGRLTRSQAARALAALRDWGRLLEQPGALAELLVETADVVAATAIGVNSGRDGAGTAELDFDVVIVDEAGQAQLTDLIVPLSRAPIVILVGDQQQLPPYLDDDLLRRCQGQGLDTAWLEQSIFEYLWERVPASHRTRLDMQFRMPHVIADFLSTAFYDGELASAPARHGGGAVCELFRSPVVFVDTSELADRGETAMSPGFVNRCEARLVADIVASLPDRYRAGEGLGVIAPYGAQVAAARQALAAALGLAPRDAWLFDNVATVDSFQGQERDVIVVSLTRSNADGAVGFVSDLHRLNVTVSRAREQLVIVGDLSTLSAAGGGFAGFARALGEHVRRNGELVAASELRRRIGR